MNTFEFSSNRTEIKAINIDGDAFEFVYLVDGNFDHSQNNDSIICFEKLQEHARSENVATATGFRSKEEILELYYTHKS